MLSFVFKKISLVCAFVILPFAALAEEMTDSTNTEPTDSIELREVVVTKDMSDVVKRLPNGNRFFLSSKAKAMSNPYMALKEIPELISNDALQTVSLLDGSTPLVLIDGVEVNSGITPILPADIESVDVITDVPVRYRLMGYTSVLDIHLRKNRPPYIWTELATRHDVPPGNGFGVWYFEIGQPKFSVYTRFSTTYSHNIESNTSSTQTNGVYNLDYRGKSKSNSINYIGEVLGRYKFTDKDYMAVNVLLTRNSSRGRNSSTGIYSIEDLDAYSVSGHDRDKRLNINANAYYLHKYSNQKQWATTLRYTYNNSDVESNSTTEIGSDVTLLNNLFDSRRHNVSLSSTFGSQVSDKFTYNIGLSASANVNEVDNKTLFNVFNHTHLRALPYVEVAGQLRKLYYSLSAGPEFTHMKSESVTNNYLRPWISARLTWNFTNRSSASLSFSQTNTSPSLSELNPYETSVDSLVVSKGNPRLKPTNNSSLLLRYTFNKWGLYLSPYVMGNFYRNLIEPTGYLTEQNQYVQTYENEGRYTSYSVGANINYSIKGVNMYVGGGMNRFFYENIRPYNLAYVNFGAYAFVKKFYFGMDLSYQPKSKTDITVISYDRPLQAFVQANYNITKDLYIAVALEGFTGKLRTRTHTVNGGFESRSVSTSNTDLRPWILIRWTLRKHVERKMDFDMNLGGDEKGLNIK